MALRDDCYFLFRTIYSRINKEARNGNKEVKGVMKIVTLCREGSCCPVVKIDEERVEIGEKDNICVLTKSEWEALKQKILNKEI